MSLTSYDWGVVEHDGWGDDTQPQVSDQGDYELPGAEVNGDGVENHLDGAVHAHEIQGEHPDIRADQVSLTILLLVNFSECYKRSPCGIFGHAKLYL